MDLDPRRWHQDHTRDQRKADALVYHHYVRIRPYSLAEVPGVTIRVGDDDFDPVHWASALRPTVVEAGAKWSDLEPADVAAALSRAALRWQQTLRGRPRHSALDSAPQLAEEFLENLTRPGVTLEWISPNANDKCCWCCSACSHEWVTSIASRAGQGSGCPTCARARVTASARKRSLPPSGESLAAVRPQLAAEFVACLTDSERTPQALRPASNLRCRWKCRTCGHVFDASPASRLRGRGCAPCGTRTAARVRSLVPFEQSVAAITPWLVRELVELVGRPDRSARDVSSGCNFRARWRCCDCGNEWQTTVASRALNGHGCPACGHNRTAAARSAPRPNESLADLHPQLAAELVANLTHPGRMGRTVRPGSHDRCRWQCSEGHEWEAVVKNRARNGAGCPHCYRASRRRA
ncbi:zinc-ribbon domain-containing protein [Kribbella sp. NPDC048928]|uniref:zinc-ribbon domain-containing protein n=1 Tax=Kribbella sp. NPDC048928 TaxID=3364111 RepID=UPI003713E5D6